MNRRQKQLTKETKQWMRATDKPVNMFKLYRRFVRFHARMSYFKPCEDCDNISCNPYKFKRYICADRR